MKRWLYSLAILPFVAVSGCQVVEDVKTEVENVPPDVWQGIKDGIVWLLTTIWDVLFGWFTGLLG